ncbi:MGDG synthase family glycosyltransferase [Virgibacillus sp. DJP39]|uniref:MGDG synthase family glycosyltransferase n=1 Tax=Virgibacillus sp. DJP39 TaxID=3409790 RepID=UPI003BB5BF80
MNHYSKTILFLPFLQIPSGHHQVAHSLMEGISSNHPELDCKKVEILSYSYGKVESLVSGTYLNWIRTFPGFYNWLYQVSVYKNVERDKKYRLYEVLFLAHIRKMVKEIQPSCIICTHSLPSYMLNHLKEKGEVNIPVINVYTDFFIHRFWGIHHVDFHFVSSLHMKELLQKKGIKEEQIYITGIPVHKDILKVKTQVRKSPSSLSILITGGNLGVGAIGDLIDSIGTEGKITYYVLCGKNKTLYQRVRNLANNNIIPLQYMESRTEMDKLYDKVDGILTKPGGVTVSEGIIKRKPIFIYDALPGQEIINLEELQKLGVVFCLNNWKDKQNSLENQLISFFENAGHCESMQTHMSDYHNQLTVMEPAEIVNQLINNY